MSWRALGWRPERDREPVDGDYAVSWSYELITEGSGPEGERRRVPHGRTSYFPTALAAESFRQRRLAHTGWIPVGASNVAVSEVKGPDAPRVPAGETLMTHDHRRELFARIRSGRIGEPPPSDLVVSTVGRQGALVPPDPDEPF